MAFSGTTYTNVSGATTAASGQVVQSAVWNNIHTDLATALTQVMSQLVAVTSFKNVLAANGSADIWQRISNVVNSNISVGASTTAYTADRWYLATGVNQACTVTEVAPLTNNSLFACAVQRNNAQTGITALTFGYPLNTDELIKVLGNKVTLSGTVKAGANFSPASGALTINFYVGTGAAGKQSAGFAGQSLVATVTLNLTPGGGSTAFSVQSSAVVPTTSTQGEVQFVWTPVGTAGAADTFTFDDIQLEANLSSTTWTPSQYERIPFEVCLQMCKRYYQKTFPFPIGVATGAGLPGALATVSIATQRLAALWLFPVEMQTTPTIATLNPTVAGANWQDHTASVSVAVNVDTSGPSTKGVLIYSTASGSTTNDLCYIHATADAGL